MFIFETVLDLVAEILKTYSDTWNHSADGKNRIYHRSQMQIKKSLPEGKRIMREMRFTEFPALSVDPRGKQIMRETRFIEFPALSIDPWVGISQFAAETCCCCCVVLRSR